MKWVYDDGGRAAAGFKGEAGGTCVTRAIAIATGKPYREVYYELNAFCKRARPAGNAKSPVWRTIHRYMKSIGWRYTSTRVIVAGCKLSKCGERIPPRLHSDGLPADEILVVVVRSHCVAVIDGVIYDTFDCGNRPRLLHQNLEWQKR